MSVRGLHLAIDATNIRSGGGVTHLLNLLLSASPSRHRFEKITIWGCRSVLEKLPNEEWLELISAPWIEARLPYRMAYHQLFFGNTISKSGCDVLFSPGGSAPHFCTIPIVTMSQNMLPFEPDEAIKFGRFSLMRLKMMMLKRSQGRSFKSSRGVIFLSNYAQHSISKALSLTNRYAIIPHGIEPRFRMEPREQRDISEYSLQNPFRLLYVSITMPYKHHCEVAEAVSQLRSEGYPIEIRFIGLAWGNYGQQLRRLIDRLDPEGDFLKWSGAEPFEKLHDAYKHSDAFVFASSCENLPNILIEAMSAGLPVACSKLGPMPEVLGDAGVYFDPNSVQSVVDTLRTLLDDTVLRKRLANDAYESTDAYSWARCADETFSFIRSVVTD